MRPPSPPCPWRPSICASESCRRRPPSRPSTSWPLVASTPSSLRQLHLSCLGLLLDRDLHLLSLAPRQMPTLREPQRGVGGIRRSCESPAAPRTRTSPLPKKLKVSRSTSLIPNFSSSPSLPLAPSDAGGGTRRRRRVTMQLRDANWQEEEEEGEGTRTQSEVGRSIHRKSVLVPRSFDRRGAARGGQGAQTAGRATSETSPGATVAEEAACGRATNRFGGCSRRGVAEAEAVHRDDSVPNPSRTVVHDVVRPRRVGSEEAGVGRVRGEQGKGMVPGGLPNAGSDRPHATLRRPLGTVATEASSPASEDRPSERVGRARF